MKRLLDGSFKALKPITTTLPTPRLTTTVPTPILPLRIPTPLDDKTLIYPLVGSFTFDQNLKPADFKNRILNLVSRNPFSFRGITSLPPLLPQSVNAYFHVRFKADDSEIICLFSKFKNLPVSMLSGGNRVLVVDKQLWDDHVDADYKKDKLVTQFSYDFGHYEKVISFERLKSAVKVAASMDEYGGELTLTAAISQIIVMFSMSCFWKSALGLMQNLLHDKDSVETIDDSLIDLFKGWTKISSAVYNGKRSFVLGSSGKECGIRYLRANMLMMDSRTDLRAFYDGKRNKFFQPGEDRGISYLREKMMQMDTREELISRLVGGELVVGEEPKFCQVVDLRADMEAKFNLLVEVESSIVAVKQGQATSDPKLQINHCLIKDSTGSVMFKAVDEQIALIIPGTTVGLLGASISKRDGKMFVEVDKWGSIIDECTVEEEDVSG